MNTNTTTTVMAGGEPCTSLQRRRRANPILLLPTSMLLTAAVVAACVCVYFVHLKICGVANERAIAALERQIHEAREDNQILEDRIAVYTSRPYLEKRLAEGVFRKELQPVMRDALVQMPVATARETLVSNVDYRMSAEVQVP